MNTSNFFWANSGEVMGLSQANVYDCCTKQQQKERITKEIIIMKY